MNLLKNKTFQLFAACIAVFVAAKYGLERLERNHDDMWE